MLSYRVRAEDADDDRAVELRLHGRHVVAHEMAWRMLVWVPATTPFARALWDFETHSVSISERTMPQFLVEVANRVFGERMRELDRPRQRGIFDGGCCVCGTDRNTFPETAVRDGYGNIIETRGRQWKAPEEPIRWRCHVCDRLVCRDCTLTFPDGVRQYYHHTYCSESCRAAAPSEYAVEDEQMR